MSLIGSDMLYKIHSRLCEIFQSEDLFANVSVLLVGDLLQLPPVKARFVFERPTNTHFAEFHDVTNLWKTFEPNILIHNHRQGNGSKWVDTLNRIREGQVTEEDEEVLRSRIIETPNLDLDSCHVFFTNAEVNSHNDKMLNCLTTELVEIPAIQTLPKGYSSFTTVHGTIDSTNFLKTLLLKVGARVVLVFNISTTDLLVNGAMGTVISIERNKANKVECIIVKFDGDRCGRDQRQKYPEKSLKYEASNGTPVFRYELEYEIGKKSKHAARAKVLQFPLRLAWANTAHKMQVNVDLLR